MRLRDDQVKLTELLKETVTLLCKNGLQFQHGFTVDALIGITTDDRETFLVMLNESVQDLRFNKDGNANGDENDNAEYNGDGNDHGRDDGDNDGSNAARSKSKASRKRSSEANDHTLTTKRQRPNSNDVHDAASYECDDNEVDNFYDDDTDVDSVKDEHVDIAPVKQEHSDNEFQLSQDDCGIPAVGSVLPTWDQYATNNDDASQQMSLTELKCSPTAPMFDDQSAISARYNTRSRRSSNNTPAPSDAQSDVKHVCETCGREFNFERALARHQRMMHSGQKVNQMKVTLSDQSTISSPLDSSHEQSKSSLGGRPRNPNGKHICYVCGNRFSYKHGLKAHLERSHGICHIKRFHCEHCPTVFKSKIWLKTHLAQAHGLDEETCLKCDHCEALCANQRHLRRHLKLYHNAVPLKCGHCHRVYHTKAALDEHMSEVEQAFKDGKLDKNTCGVCYVKFQSYKMLRRHSLDAHDLELEERKCGGLQPVTHSRMCDLCGKMFAMVGYVKIHKRLVHNVGDVLSFCCDRCSKVFKRKSYLDRHMTCVHGVGDDVKTFKCTICFKVFTEKGNCVAHVKRVHGQSDTSAHCETLHSQSRMSVQSKTENSQSETSAFSDTAIDESREPSTVDRC